MLDKNFTQEWWRRVVSDPDKLLRWLEKLEYTEWEGFAEHARFLRANSINMTNKQIKILQNIAEDELTHSSILYGVISDRGGTSLLESTSTYWADMLEPRMSFVDYCAANYFGEELAAWRFEVIYDMPETPGDIKEFIAQALPDEIFHRETLRRQAGDEAVERLRVRHEAALAKLLKK